MIQPQTFQTSNLDDPRNGYINIPSDPEPTTQTPKPTWCNRHVTMISRGIMLVSGVSLLATSGYFASQRSYAFAGVSVVAGLVFFGLFFRDRKVTQIHAKEITDLEKKIIDLLNEKKVLLSDAIIQMEDNVNLRNDLGQMKSAAAIIDGETRPSTPDHRRYASGHSYGSSSAVSTAVSTAVSRFNSPEFRKAFAAMLAKGAATTQNYMNENGAAPISPIRMSNLNGEI